MPIMVKIMINQLLIFCDQNCDYRPPPSPAHFGRRRRPVPPLLTVSPPRFFCLNSGLKPPADSRGLFHDESALESTRLLEASLK